MKAMKIPSSTRLRNDIREKTMNYLERTTFHGVLYFTRPEHHIIKFMWLLIIVFGIILCGVLCKMTLTGYHKSPTVVVVESTHFPINDLKFPAIVVCDPRNYVYRPHTANITTIFLRRGYNKTLITAFYDALSTFNTTSHLMSPTIVKMHDILQDLGITLPLLLDMFATPCDKLLSHCFWRSQQYNCTDMFYRVAHNVGYCCRFDLKYFSTNTINTTYFASGYMSSEGLRFLVNYDVKGTHSTGSNINVCVVPPHRPMMLTDDAIPVTTFKFYEFTINAWLIETSKSAKLLAVDNRRCLINNKDSYSEASYHSGCIIEGFHSKLLEECKCRPFYYNSIKASDYPNCTWVQYECIFDFLDTFTIKKANITSQFACYPDCDHVEYIPLVDFAPLTRSKIYTKQQSVITAHFSGNPCVKYRRNLIFTWDQLLASLGGLFGLCTGGSIISVIELLLFVSDVLVTITLDLYREWSKKRNISTQLGRNQVFFIRPKYDYTE